MSTTVNVEPAAQPATVRVDTLAFGNTGVRCFVGNTSFACVAGTRVMTLGPSAFWTFVGSAEPPVRLEPGFTPGELVFQATAGDITFAATNSCHLSSPHGGPEKQDASKACSSIKLIPNVPYADDGVLVGVVSAVSATTLRIRMTDSELPVPQPAVAQVYFRTTAGRQVSPNQPVKVRAFTFTLYGATLRIDGPRGPLDIGV